MHLECGTLWIPYLCQFLDYTPTPVAQSIVCVDKGNFVAGALYDHFNGVVVTVHIVVQGRPPKEWWFSTFDYGFNVLKIKKALGQVRSNNDKALKLDFSLGFVEEARIRGYYQNGDDMIIVSMTREQCRILNNSRWARVQKGSQS
jgi:hypothetical protein